MNILGKNYQTIRQLLIYKPPQRPTPFVLDEVSDNSTDTPPLEIAFKQYEALLRYGRRISLSLEKLCQLLKEAKPPDLSLLKLEITALEQQLSEISPIIKTYNLLDSPLDRNTSTSLAENKMMLENAYNLPDNKDLVTRDFIIPATEPVKAFLAFIDGLVDNNAISLTALQPLLLLGESDRNLYGDDLVQKLITKYLPNNQIRLASTLRDVTESLNLGDTAIFLDGIAEVLLVNTKGQEHRSIDRPSIEQSVRGSQSAFTEALRTNTGLIRSMLRTNDLTTEIFTIGKRSNKLCALMYLKEIINPSLVKEAKRRLTSLEVDNIVSSGALQLAIEDHPLIPFPQFLATERPDRVAASLTEGRLAIVLDGSPFVLVAPISIFTLLHSAEDFAFSWIVGSFTRILRFSGIILTVMLPALYLAISYFHQEALPTELILAIGAARERVPFPSILEILMMEFSFELLREAGIRIPGMLGATIGIVGAIILGQAAVSAGIVSPITVVIIAITGLASFAIADYSLAAAIRLIRFVFEILAAMLGLVGVASGLVVIMILLCGIKSLGVPYLTPIAPKTTPGYDTILRGPVYSQELRPDELNTQNRRRQASIARGWIKTPPVKEGDES